MIVIKKMVVAVLLFMVNINAIFADSSTSLVSITDGHDLSLVHQAELLGPVDDNMTIDFVVWLKLRNSASLDKLINDLYDPSHLAYQKFLTKEEFDKQFGPSQEAAVAVSQYFNNQGMTAEIGDHYVHVKANARQIKKVLHTTLNHYRYENRVVYANSREPQVDKNIATYVSAIVGLDNMVLFHPMHKKSPESATNPHPSAASVPNRSLSGKNMQIAYGYPNIKPINGVKIDGAGQTIVVIAACSGDSPDIIRADANTFSTANGLPLMDENLFTIIGQTGGTAPSTGSGCAGFWSVETSIDVQASHALAPAAKIVLIIANTGSIGNLSIADNYAIQHYPGAAVTHSWGGREGDTRDTVYTPLLQQAAAQGLSMAFSSGDSGDNMKAYNMTTPSVNYPSNLTYAIAIGGTSLHVHDDWRYLFESGWGTTHIYPDRMAYVSGSGGGMSRVYPALTAQATAISSFIAPGYTGDIGSTSCSGQVCRAVPDIGMDADPFTGFYLYNTTHCQGLCSYGGTSVSSPLFAGVVALVNQARWLVSGGNSRPIGLITPYLYSQIYKLKGMHALHVISPPHLFIPKTTVVPGYPSAYVSGKVGYNMDSSLAVLENQFWNDVCGVGTPNLPQFVLALSTL